MEKEIAELKRQHLEQHENTRQQALQDLETIRREALRLQKEGRDEAERIHNDALQFRQQTQQQCESLIQRSRQEAAGVQDGANRYAEQTLGELEVRLKEMAQVVMAGRQELSKIQAIRSTAPTAKGTDDSKTVPISRAHRAASRLRSMRGNG
jgi:dsDNA-specific endonuclease/ATPase MutS2